MENLIELEELNAMETDFTSIPISVYFGDMEGLTEDQKSTREEFADEMLDLLLMMYSLMDVPGYNEHRVIMVVLNQYSDIVKRFNMTDDYTTNYVNKISAEIVHTTYSHRDKPYYTSYDRATRIAENEANTIVNHNDFESMRSSGKKNKTWHTMLDERVRPTHWQVEGVTMPIDEPFLVGDSLLMFPKDMSLGADLGELVNCRCWIIYS